jgi:HAMP domain-containing protein
MRVWWWIRLQRQPLSSINEPRERQSLKNCRSEQQFQSPKEDDMNFLKGTILTLVLMFAAASLGFAQGSTNNPGCPDGTTTCAGAVGVGNATVYNITGGNGKQAMNAIAGTAGEIFPQYAPEGMACTFARPFLYRHLTWQEILSMRKSAGKVHKVVTILDPDAVPDGKTGEEVGIDTIDWFPQGNGVSSFDDDQVIATVYMEGQYLHDDGVLGEALYEAETASHTNRVALLRCTKVEAKTKGLNIGFGGSSSHMSDADPVGYSAGFDWGSNTGYREDDPKWYVVAMNPGPIQKSQPKKRDDAASTQLASPQQPAAPMPPQKESAAQPQQPAQPQPIAQSASQQQVAPNIIIEKLEVVMPPQLRSGSVSGRRKAAAAPNNVVNNYNITTNTAQPPCPTFSIFCWTWPWHIRSWLWQLLGLLLLIAFLLLAINWIVRRAIRRVPADATFELIEARTTVAERNISEVVNRSTASTIDAINMSTAALNAKADKVLADWEARQKAARKAAKAK